jgi:hypothetical protein
MSVLNLARAIVAELDGRVSHGTVPSSVPWDSGRRPGADGANGTDGAHGTDLASRAAAPETLEALPCPATVAERSAIIEEADHCDRNAADHRALAEAGHASWQGFSDIHRMQIAAALKQLPPPRDYNGCRLIAETRRFLSSEWFSEALRCGWTLEELFGIDAHAPLERFEQWGLVVGLALAPKPGDMIENLDAEHAVIGYRVGSPPKEARRIERRFVPADSSPPWWECSALVSNAEWLTQLSEPC